ncbi:hypothetical protein [Frederiksenia canicola]
MNLLLKNGRIVPEITESLNGQAVRSTGYFAKNCLKSTALD